MHFGALIFFTDYSIGPVELARALEQRGLEFLWVAEHSHIPLSRKSPFPPGGELPKKYYDVMDPFVTLGAAAAVTTRLKLGTGICLVIQRDTIQTRQAGGEPRPDLQRPLPVRHRRRLERGGDGRPRHRLQGAVRGDARARRGHARDLDQVEARVRGPLREVRTHDDVAEAGAEAASAGHRRRRLSLWRAARDRLRRRLGAATRAGPPTATCSTCCPRSTRC